MNHVSLLSLLLPGSPLAVLIVWTVLLAALLLVCARRADGSPYLRLVFPTLLVQILNPDSRKCGFGWTVFVLASCGALLLKNKDGLPLFDASTWLLCVSMSSVLIGGGTIMDAKHELEVAKLNAASTPPAAS